MTVRSSIASSEAKKLLDAFGVSNPSDIDIEAIAFDLGAIVTEGPLSGASGRLVLKGSRGVIRVDSGISEDGQKRFCIAHELGHFVLHAKREPLWLCEPETMMFWYRARPEELEANAFAAEILMPTNVFKGQCKRGDLNLEAIEGLARDFRTTLSATAIRYADIGPHVCAVVMCHRGQIQWFHKAPDFRWRIREIRTPIDEVTCAADFFSRGIKGKQIDDIPALAWLEDEVIDPCWTIREMIVPMPTYNSSLSLLWAYPGSSLDRFEEDD